MSDSPPAGSAPVDPGSPDARRDAIGWPRAIASGLAILVVGIGVGVYGSQFAIDNLTGFSRDQKVWLVTAIMTVTVVVMAWVLRRLQARGSI